MLSPSSKIKDLRDYVTRNNLNVNTTGDGRSPAVKRRIYDDIVAAERGTGTRRSSS